MLLMLAQYLTQFESAFGVFQYLTLRGILATGTALAISLLVGPAMIRKLSYHQVGQATRRWSAESPEQGGHTNHGRCAYSGGHRDRDPALG